MNAKEYLCQSLRIRRHLVYLRERIEKLEADLGYKSKRLDDSGASKGTMIDTWGETAAELMDLESEWEKDRIRLERKNNEIRQTLERLEKTEHIELLTYRYIHENRRYPARLNSWEAVAFMLGLSMKSAKVNHTRALKALERLLNETT